MFDKWSYKKHTTFLEKWTVHKKCYGVPNACFMLTANLDLPFIDDSQQLISFLLSSSFVKPSGDVKPSGSVSSLLCMFPKNLLLTERSKLPVKPFTKIVWFQSAVYVSVKHLPCPGRSFWWWSPLKLNRVAVCLPELDLMKVIEPNGSFIPRQNYFQGRA